MPSPRSLNLFTKINWSHNDGAFSCTYCMYWWYLNKDKCRCTFDERRAGRNQAVWLGSSRLVLTVLTFTAPLLFTNKHSPHLIPTTSFRASDLDTDNMEPLPEVTIYVPGVVIATLQYDMLNSPFQADVEGVLVGFACSELLFWEMSKCLSEQYQPPFST